VATLPSSEATETTGGVEQPTAAARATDTNLTLQTPGSAPTDTPTPAGPQFAIPILKVESSEVRPFMLRGLLSTDKVALSIHVRVENVGNADLNISTNNFIVRTRDTGQVFNESGGNLSEEALKRLGAINRFNDLNLSPGGSVIESLIFDLDPESYDLELVFQTPKTTYPIILGLGTIHAGRELSLVLGTPVAEETLVAAATPTTEPTPTPTRPAIIPAPQVVPRSALAGTIAYPVFNGNNYNIHFGKVDGSGTKLFRTSASQPAFNADGSRIAFHSWSGDARGLVTMDVSGANATLISNFIEDQLPTWSADGKDIILLTRRSGGRQSELISVESATEIGPSTPLGEGEYPTVGANGQLVFKGWGATAYGLRHSSPALENIQSVTNVDEDTAPALSPDGKQVVFMSRREENWDIYVVNVDGSGLQRLTNDPADDGLPTWSPDGNAVAFVSNRGGPWAVWAMTPDGAGKRQLFTMEGTPDGFVGTDTYASRGWAEERISWTSANFDE
jgi:TolB protein